MLIHHTVLFDGDVQGTGAVYTSPDSTELIGSVAARRVWGVVSGVSGTSPTLTVEFEETGGSDDSRYWQADQAGVPIISAAALSASAVNIVSGYDDGAAADGALGRARIQLGGTSPSAHVRLWVTGRHADPSTAAPGTFVVYNEAIFDEYMDGTGALYSRPDLNLLLPLADQYAIRGAAFIESGTSPTLTVQLEQSPDNSNWGNASGTPEINGVALNVGAITTLTKSTGGAAFPMSGYMRARVQLGGTTPKGRVKLWITGRGEQPASRQSRK